MLKAAKLNLKGEGLKYCIKNTACIGLSHTTLYTTYQNTSLTP